MGDFKVYTNGHCFLCTDKIPFQVATVKLEPHSGHCAHYSVHSLQYLSRYLKMDMRKVFDEESVVPPELLAKVEKAKLKVELCEECASLNESFSKIYRQLEKMEMGAAAYMTIINSKLMRAKEIPEIDSTYTEGVFNGKLKIAEVLRDEAKKKCSHKLKTVPGPRIKIENRSMKQLAANIKEIRGNSLKLRQTMATESKTSTSETTGMVKYIGVKKEDRNSDTDDDNINTDTFDDADDDNDDDDNIQSDGLEGPSSFSDSAAEVTTSSVMNVEPEVDKSVTAYNLSQYEIIAGAITCTICKATFSTKGHWKDHYENIHLKVRYKCTLCGKEFVQRSTFTRHHKTIHMGIKFKCLICKKTFSGKAGLTRHQRTSSCKT